MRKITVFTFLIVSFLTSAQSYDFTTLTKYKTVFEGNEREDVTYSNLKNDTYFLKIFKETNILTARLYDLKNNTVHNFGVIEHIVKNEINFEFKYKNSINLTIDKNRFTGYEYEFKTIHTDSLSAEIILNIYKNSGRKTAVLTLNLVTTKKPENQFHLFQFSCLHPFEFENIKTNDPFLVINAKGKTLNNKSIEHTLTIIKDVDFRLKIK